MARLKEIKKTAYRLLAVLLVFSMLGANLTTLSYASEEAGAEPETYCGYAQHVHEAGVCFTEETVLTCGMEEGTLHTHDADNCFEARQELVCQLAEEEAHTHDESCRQDVTTYICGKDEVEPHTHADTCYTDNKTLTCELTEREAHAHSEACFALQDKLTCAEEVYEAHTHGDGCYGQQDKLTCAEEVYDAHTHGESCYGTERQLTCGQSEQVAHSHGDGCYAEETTLSCTSAEEGHEHTDGCYTTSRTLSCGEVETAGHAHGEACYSDVQVCTCTLKEGPGHAHGENCYTPETVLTCTAKEGAGHAHGAECYVQEQVNVCGKQEIAEGHAHGETCYTASRDLTCGKEEVAEGHTHTEDCTQVESALCCGKEETAGHAHSETCYETRNVQICTLETGVPHEHGETCYTTEITMTCEQAEHIHTEECYVVPEPEKILICTDPDHEHTDACYALPEELEEERSITDENNLVTVTGLLPETATVQARPLTEEELAALPVPVEQLLFAYDITIWVDGAEYQPETPVQVTVLPQTEPEQAVQEVLVQHIELDEETSEFTVTEVINTADELTGEVTFSAESFSIYIGTVVKELPVLNLLSGKGYSFYVTDNNVEKAISGELVWDEKSGTTIKVKVNTGFELDTVTVRGTDGSESDQITVTINAEKTLATIAFAKNPVAGTPSQRIEVTTIETGKVIYFDLAAGDVLLTTSTYTGYVYPYGDTTAERQIVTGNYDESYRYYVYQSAPGNRATTGMKDDETVVLPTYAEPEVTVDGEKVLWSEYITNQTDVKAVRRNWDELATAQGRVRTKNEIRLQINDKDCDLTLDNVWADEERSAQTTGDYGDLIINAAQNFRTENGKSVYDSYVNSSAVVRIKGANSFGKVYYTCTSTQKKELIFTSADGNGHESGSLTVVGRQEPVSSSSYYKLNYEDNPADSTGKPNVYTNFWNSVIGGNDSVGTTYGMKVHGGTIYAGSTWWENCTAFGAGGNDHAEVTITGGRLTAVAYTTGTAIGGGIAHTSKGGSADVKIHGGKVFAYNFGQPGYKTVDFDASSITDETVIRAASHIAGTAIGGASSIMNVGNYGKVTITGGEVYAESLGGAALGGGNSVTRYAGYAIIDISGGKVEAKSTGAVDYTGGEVPGFDVAPGAAIGGGTGGVGKEYETGKWDAGNGGYAKVTISGGEVITGSIGGGGTNNAAKRNDGKASGTLGYAQVEISGGDVSGQVIMAATGEEITESNKDKICKFTMTGGTLHDSDVTDAEYPRVQKNGGAVYMDDPYGIADISDGSIENCSAENGGAVYMTAGKLTLSGDGVIRNCVAIDADDATVNNGGAIYMGSSKKLETKTETDPETNEEISVTEEVLVTGIVNITGGTIENCSADNGGAIAMGGGELTMTGGTVQTNEAEQDGGAIYMGSAVVKVNEKDLETTGVVHIRGGSILTNTATDNGGGVYVENGNIIMSGGAVDGNHAKVGGGMYVSAPGDDVNVGVKIFSGSVSNNVTTEKGGAIAVVGNAEAKDQKIGITIGIKGEHLHTDDVDAEGNPVKVLTPVWHDADGKPLGDGVEPDAAKHYYHTSCPVINNNSVTDDTGSGGAVYINGSAKGSSTTTLSIYCLKADENKVAGGGGRSDFMKVDGGRVIISSAEDEQLNQPDQPPFINDRDDNLDGKVDIRGSLHVEGGQVDLWGGMQNPSFLDRITVDVKPGSDDYFADHRYVEPGTSYKLLYFENFQGSGQYTAYQINHGDTHTFLDSLYYHSGYLLQGWNTDPDAKTSGDGHWFYAGNEATFPGLVADGFDEDGNLTIYAIWDPNGYDIHFESNIPVGTQYQGSMEPDQRLTFDQEAPLKENAYKWKGHIFTGWCTVPDPEGLDPATYQMFADKQPVTNLATENNSVVTLYAQWVVCNHDPADPAWPCSFTYDVVNDGKTLRRSCSCGGQVLTATLSASNTTYNGSVQKTAKVSYSGDWTPEMEYVVPEPINADTYEVRIYSPDNAVFASVTYTIRKASQDPPNPPPTYVEGEVAGNKVAKIHPLTTSGHGPAEYRLMYYQNGVVNYTEWQTALVSGDPLYEDGFAQVIPLEFAYTNYYVQARYQGDKNYEPSPPAQAKDVIVFDGATIEVNTKEGVLCPWSSKEGDGVTLMPQLEPGYYLPTGEFTVEIACTPTEDMPIKTDLANQAFKFTDIKPDSKIVVTIGGAKKEPVARIAEKQIFGTFANDPNAKISADSAFTAYFEVSDYDGEHYKELQLTFDKHLPEDTTIILQDRGGDKLVYYYYRVPVGGVKAVSLDSFQKMGVSVDAPFTVPTEESQTLQYQFVVDYSQSSGGVIDDQTVALSFKTTDTVTKTTTADAVTQLEEGIFTMSLSQASPTETDGFSRELKVRYTPSEGAASKWDGRSAALVLTVTGDYLPPDILIEAVIEDTHGEYRPVSGNQFIIPLEQLDVGDITLKLKSDLVPNVDVTYKMRVDWYVSDAYLSDMYIEGGQSFVPEAGRGALNGEPVHTNQLTVTFQKDAAAQPALAATGDKWVAAGSALAVSVTMKNLPENSSVTAVIQQKILEGDNAGEYANIGREPIDIGKVGDRFTVPFDRSAAGAYRLWFTVEYADKPILTYPYYFLVTTAETCTVSYYENFENSGIYTAHNVTVPSEYVLEPALYQHDGYMLVGWSTEPDGADQNTYPAGEKLFFAYDTAAQGRVKCNTASGMTVNLNENGNLTLYAQWQPVDSGGDTPTTG